MHKTLTAVMLACMVAVPASASSKFKGKTTLKDVQTTGSPDKNHKHQQYDLLFDTKDKSYTCRTDGNHSMNATDFVVGTQIKYEVDDKEGTLKTTDNKEVKCKIVRVAIVEAAKPSLASDPSK